MDIQDNQPMRVIEGLMRVFKRSSSTTDRAGCDDLSSGSRAVHGVLIHVTQPWRSKLILAF